MQVIKLFDCMKILLKFLIKINFCLFNELNISDLYH